MTIPGKGRGMVRHLDPPLEHCVRVHLEHPRHCTDTETFRERAHRPSQQVGCHPLAMQDGAVVLREGAAARGTLQLTPGATIGMAMGPQIPPSQPAAIATASMGTEVPGGVHRAGAAVGWGHRLGWHRRWRLGMHGFLRPPGTRGFVRQARKRLGLVGACALGLDGCHLGWPRLGSSASAGPDGRQQHTEPQ